MNKHRFNSVIYNHFKKFGRSMPWRYDSNPYHILVSEVMLQQTQVERVKPKFEAFIKRFPTIEILASLTLQEIYGLWSGLGYNRRAKYLRDAAKIIVEKYNSTIPHDPAILMTLPGVGKATAGAICAYAYNLPVVFIETNIRASILFTFYLGKTNVSDTEITNTITNLIDIKNPREWYYAVVDYGEMLKKKLQFSNVQSKTYAKQSKFEGSDRQIRGAIMGLLIQKKIINKSTVEKLLLKRHPKSTSVQITRAFRSLENDKLIKVAKGYLSFE